MGSYIIPVIDEYFRSLVLQSLAIRYSHTKKLVGFFLLLTNNMFVMCYRIIQISNVF